MNKFKSLNKKKNKKHDKIVSLVEVEYQKGLNF